MLYDFDCLDCGKEFEYRCKMQDRDSATCPSCRSDNVRQTICRSTVSLGDAARVGFSAYRSGFNEVLSNIHKKTPGSILDKTTNI